MIAHVAGWLAHWKEQLAENRIFWATQIYIGKQKNPHSFPEVSHYVFWGSGVMGLGICQDILRISCITNYQLPITNYQKTECASFGKECEYESLERPSSNQDLGEGC